MLEASLRNLVNEEASRAALAAIEKIEFKAPIDPVTKAELIGAVERATTAAHARLVGSIKVKVSGISEVPASLDHGQLAECRAKALAMAIEVEPEGGDALFPLAAKMARFIIDGCMDGEPREDAEA